MTGARMRALVVAVVTAASIISMAGVGTSAQAAQTAPCSAFKYDLRQVVRPTTNANLLTRWDDEVDIADEDYGFTSDLGVLAEVASAPDEGLVAINRLYKSGDFVWAEDGADTDDLVDVGYRKLFLDFYAAESDSDCLAPVYRFKRGSIHRMATETDSAALSKDGWAKEKVAFYAKTDEVETPPPAPAPPANGTDTKFTIAVLPDTQNEVENPNGKRFSNRVSWLTTNKSALDMRYAIQVGDLVDWGNVVPAQFAKASAEIKPLEAVVPWAPVIGNHDTAAVCLGGSSCPGANTSLSVRNTSGFNTAFPVSRFPNVRGTFEPNKIDNSYQTFSAGGVDWLVLSLELWPRREAVAWAKTVVASHPNANVIVATHAYLEPNGSIMGNQGGYGSTSPQYLYDNLIKVYPNIRFVLSGHVGNSATRTDVGDNGNKIVSLLQCFHSSSNPVRLLEIDTAAGTANSRVYAPYTKTDYPAWSTSNTGLDYVK